MWVCSTTLARGLPAWMRAWMKKAVASTSYLPSTMLPAPSAITRSDGVISDQCRPCGLTRKRSSRPGTVILKWLHTPSLMPCLAAVRCEVVRSIRAWVTGSLASIKRSPLPKDVTSGDDAAKPIARPSEIESPELTDGSAVSLAAGGAAGQAMGRPGRPVGAQTLVLSVVAPGGGSQRRWRRHGALPRRDRRAGRRLAGALSALGVGTQRRP